MSGYEKSPDYGGGGGGTVNWRRVAVFAGWVAALAGMLYLGLNR